jgi:hypothetical protein
MVILLSDSSADSAHGFLAPREPALMGVLSHAMLVESSQGKAIRDLRPFPRFCENHSVASTSQAQCVLLLKLQRSPGAIT